MNFDKRYAAFFLTVGLLMFISGCASPPAEVAVVPSPPAPEPVIEESCPAVPLPEIEVEDAYPIVEEEIPRPAPDLPEEAVDEKQADTAAAAETEIPVIEPKKLEPREAFVEPVLKILLFGEANSIVVRSKGELILTFDGEAVKVNPGQQLIFRPRSSRIGVRMYPVGIATFRASDYEKAIAFAEKWKRDGYTVRVIKAGGPFTHPDGSVGDTTVYWIALGSFKKKEDAEQFKNKMNNWGMSAWIIDESVLNPKGNIEIVEAGGNIKAYADTRVSLAGQDPIEIRNVPFGHGFWSSGNCENRTYSSPLEILIDKQGTLAAINLVSLEEYVKGIVPVEIRLTAPDEALKAQAISARTEALNKLGIKHVFDPYDYCASQHCQEFGGLTRCTERTNAAVEATRGLVLMRDGELIDAVYSANCGGHTEHNENVWSGSPEKALRGVSDLYSNPDSFDSPVVEAQMAGWMKATPRAYCADPRTGGDKCFRWEKSFTAKELNAAVNSNHKVGTVKDIKILKRGVSGRVLRMKIIGSRDSVIIYKELQIRYALGKLKSTMFLVDIKRDASGNPVSFHFRGGGWGHGVGMCQAGAEGMALQGFSCSAILKHYFSGAEISRLYN